MYELTGSPFMLGPTGAVKAIPMITFGMFAGVLAWARVAFIGIGGTYFFQSVVYLCATWWAAEMIVPDRGSEKDEYTKILESLMEGLRYIKSDSTILALMALALVPTLLEHPYISLMTIFAKAFIAIGPGIISEEARRFLWISL